MSNPAASATSRLHPYLLEQGSYRLDANLFVMVATPLFVLSLALLAFSMWQAVSPERHAAMRRLAKRGRPREVATRIENGFARAGTRARVGPMWIDREWAVALRPSLLAYNAEDLVAAGLKRTVTKSGSEIVQKHALHFWCEGCISADELEVSSSEGQAILAALAERMPWASIEDVDVFARRWSDDRQACVQDAAARRAAR